jgi:peptidyl-prolyl cis-trans isomerase D
MLQTIRDRLTGPVLWVVIGVIAVPFAFWGIQSARTGGTDPTVAEVGGVKITQAQFRRKYEDNYQNLVRYMGASFRPDMIDPQRLRKGTLDDMIQEILLREAANQQGYRASDAALLDRLRIEPAFQKDGAFSAEAYRQALAAHGLTPDGYEAQQRDGIVVEQLRDAVLDGAFVGDGSITVAYQLAHEKRSFATIRIDPSKYVNDIAVTDQQVHAQYDAHKDQYLSPERIKLAYVELALDKLPKATAPSADVLKAVYEAEKAARFSTPEERHAQHILIKFGADKEAALKKAESLADQLKKSADFASLAKENSDDAGSKTAGGDLGWVRRGMMPAPFDAALFNLKPGEISAPVESPYGWHVIRLVDVHPEVTKPFEDAGVQQQLLEIYQQRDAAQHFQDASEKLDQIAFENPSSLDAVTKALGLTVQTTDWLTRNSTDGIAKAPAVVETAFSNDVLNAGENSKPLSIGTNDLIVIRKADYEAPRQQPFEEVAARIRDRLKAEGANAKARTIADAIVADLKQGKSIDAAAKAWGLTVQTVADAEHTQKDTDPALLVEVFKLPRPAAGAVSVGRVDLAQNAVAVVAVTAVKNADLKPVSDPEMRNLIATLRDQQAGAEFEAYRSALQKHVGVKTYSESPES